MSIGCLAVRVGCSEDLHRPAKQPIANAGRLEVLDEVGQDEGPAGPVKEIHLSDQCSRHEALSKGVAPRRRRLLATYFADHRPGTFARQPWRAIALRPRIASRPIAEVGMVKGIGCNQIANRSQPVDCATKAVIPGDRRVDPHLSVRHTHDRHARRKWQRQSEIVHPDFGTIDDPDIFRERLQGIERR